MDIILGFMQVIVVLSGSLAAFMSILLFVRLRWPAPARFALKLFASAWSPWFTLIGALTTVVGLSTGSALTIGLGVYNLLIFLIHIYRVTRPQGPASSFTQVFGLHWKDRVPPGQKAAFLSKRTILKLPAVPEPRLEQDIPFATIPGNGRRLLCDLWQPPQGVSYSGLAFIYLHGSAWYLLDKDLGTRPFFHHLAAQGHVIMDVAYRLAPETDMTGMVNDVQRAIAWVKEHAGTYGVNPDRIVVGGGSAGGHLALMAAYTANDPRFIAKELEGKDTTVCGVLSLYGPADLQAMYYHTNQHLTTRSTPGQPKKAAPTQMPGWMIKSMGDDYQRLGMDKGFENAGAFAPLLGGHPDECPETYALFSPVNHVQAGCPPTLLLHGAHDLMAPVESTRLLYARLVEKKVPAVLHILPQTDHAFDLITPVISPSAHNAIYDVERFLAAAANLFAEVQSDGK